MNLWGYKINNTRTIDYDKNDHSLYVFTDEKAPSSRLCIECGGCTATCTAGNLTDLNIRRLQMLMKRGDCDDAADDLKKCMLCGKCLLVCPRGVDTRKMILAMVEFYRQKEKKINEGYVLR